MRQFRLLYFGLGGLMLLSTTIVVMYFVLFGQEASEAQYTAAVCIGFTGVVFLMVANELARK